MNKIMKNYIPVLLMSLSFIPNTVHASGSEDLMGLFETAAFSGSWEVFSKFQGLGAAMQFFISACCLFGMYQIAEQTIVTLLERSNPALFETIHALKSSGKGLSLIHI